MTGTTYTGTITVGLTLSDPSTQLPVSITTTGNISRPQGNAITGLAGTAWTINNDGVIQGAYYGVYLASGGLVTNTAFIGNAGVSIAGALGTVVNSGTMGRYGRGAVLTAGGTVTNTPGGIIGSVSITGASGSLGNSGILSYALISLGGTVTNSGGASITNFVSMAGAAGLVLNDGSIDHAGSSPTLSAVGLALGGAVTNSASGRISSGSDGIAIGGAIGAAVNAGVIEVTQTNAPSYGFHVYQHANAIRLTGGGTVTNTGSLSAGGVFNHVNANFYPSLVAGIISTGAVATVTNAGTINALGEWSNFGTY